MKKIRFLALLVCCVMLAANLLACSPTEQKVTIVFAETLTSPERTEYVKSLIAKFEESNPNIHVELNSLPWEQAHDKLITQVSTKQTPDVVEINDNWLPEFGNMGALVDLTPYFEKWEYKDDYLPSALLLGQKIGNKQHSLSYGQYIRAMFYRKDWLEAAGLPVPQTYDELVETAIKLTDPSKNQFGYSFRGGKGVHTQMANFLYAQTDQTEYFDKNDKCYLRHPKIIPAFEQFCELYFKAAPPDSLNWGYNEKVSAFTSGQTGFLMQDSEVILTCEKTMKEDQWATAPLPVSPSGKRLLSGGGFGFAMFENSKNKDAAWKFISFMLSPQVNTEWNKRTSTIPVMKGALADPYFSTGAIKSWTETVTGSSTTIVDLPTFPEWTEFFDKVSVNCVQAYLLKEKSSAEAIDEMATFLEDAYAKHKE